MKQWNSPDFLSGIFRIMTFFHKIIFVFASWTSAQSDALNYSASVVGGLLQQPTSQYYHAGYGADIAVSTKTEAFGLRAIYFERPKFAAQGFEDQDRGYALLATSTFWRKDKFKLLGGAGIGRFEGYTKSIVQSSGLESRSFGIPGMAVWGEIARDIGKFRISIMHWTHIGYAGEDQFSAVVAWPFSVFGFSFGWIT